MSTSPKKVSIVMGGVRPFTVYKFTCEETMKAKISLRDLCREVGVTHLEVVEVLRRVRDNVIDDDAEVITQTVGTFYASKHKARTRTLNGIVYNVPAKVVVALRGPRFPGRVVDNEVLVHDISVGIGGRTSFVDGGVSSSVRSRVTDDVDCIVTIVDQIPSGVYTVDEFRQFGIGRVIIDYVATSDNQLSWGVFRINNVQMFGLDEPYSDVIKLDGTNSQFVESSLTVSTPKESGSNLLYTVVSTVQINRALDFMLQQA